MITHCVGFCSLIANTAVAIYIAAIIALEMKTLLNFKAFSKICCILKVEKKLLHLVQECLCVCVWSALFLEYYCFVLCKLLIYFHSDININFEHLFQVFRCYYFREALKVILHICTAMPETGLCIRNAFVYVIEDVGC